LPSILPAQRDGQTEWREGQTATQRPSKPQDAANTSTPTPRLESNCEVRRGGAEERLGVSPADAALPSLQDAGIQRHLVEMLSQADIERRAIHGCDRTIYVGQEFSNLNYLIRHRARNPNVHHFPDNRASHQYLNHRSKMIPQEAFYLPTSAVVDELLERYFRLVNPGFPILDEDVFMRQYRSRDPLDPPSLLVLQAVLLVGAHLSTDCSDRDEVKAGFFRRAKMLWDGGFERKRDAMIQAALLLTWHSEGIEDVSANAYYWISTAARTAFGIGMHRDCESSAIVAQDRRVWKRLWWILVQFDVLVTLSYGRPQSINLEDADVPPLDRHDFDARDENINVDFVVEHTELCVIFSQSLRERFGLRVPPSQKTVALQNTDRKLVQWMTNLPASLSSRMLGDIPLWSAMLHINYNNFLVLLHRPSPRTVEPQTAQPEDIGTV
jgi:transcriptional regulatory protein AMDR